MDDRKKTLAVGGGIALVIALVIGVGYWLVGPAKPAGAPKPPAGKSTADSKVEVEQAYLRFWDSWAEANKTLDARPLNATMEGAALAISKDLIREGRDKNEPLDIRVKHNYTIHFPREGFATVEDNFVDRSVRLDPATGQPTGPEVNETIRNSYTLKLIKGRWKVTEILGYRSPSP